MRYHIEKYLASEGWVKDGDGDWVGTRMYLQFEGEFEGDAWILLGSRNGDELEYLDEGDTLGELKLALAGLSDQATQGAI